MTKTPRSDMHGQVECERIATRGLASPHMDITLLGPQRRAAGARAAVSELIPDGPVATINAGWREREADTEELDGVLGGRMVNLELYRRWRQLTQDDPSYAERSGEDTSELQSRPYLLCRLLLVKKKKKTNKKLHIT